MHDLQAVQAWHADIHNHDVWFYVADQVKRLLAVFGFAYASHSERGPVDPFAQALPDQSVVIRNENFQHGNENSSVWDSVWIRNKTSVPPEGKARSQTACWVWKWMQRRALTFRRPMWLFRWIKWRKL